MLKVGIKLFAVVVLSAQVVQASTFLINYYTDERLYSPEQEPYREDIFAHKWQGCHQEYEHLLCPVVWKTQFRDDDGMRGINHATMTAYFPAHSKTKKQQAIALLMRRITMNPEWLADPETYEEKIRAFNSFREGFRDLLSKTASDHQLAYCHKNDYWGPSVNSSSCEFVNIRTGMVTHVEHGDADG